jgi:hypothetical protein
MAVQKLFTLYNTHVNRFGSQLVLSLSQIQVLIYNVMFFGYDAFPFRTIDGAVLTASNPWRIKVINEILLTQEFRFIYHMLEQAGQGAELKTIAQQMTDTPVIDRAEPEQLPQPVSEPEKPRQEPATTDNTPFTPPVNDSEEDFAEPDFTAFF